MKGRGGGCLIPTLLSLEKAEVEYLEQIKNYVNCGPCYDKTSRVIGSGGFTGFREGRRCFLYWPNRMISEVALLSHRSKHKALVLLRGQKNKKTQTQACKLGSVNGELLLFPRRSCVHQKQLAKAT